MTTDNWISRLWGPKSPREDVRQVHRQLDRLEVETGLKWDEWEAQYEGAIDKPEVSC